MKTLILRLQLTKNQWDRRLAGHMQNVQEVRLNIELEVRLNIVPKARLNIELEVRLNIDLKVRLNIDLEAGVKKYNLYLIKKVNQKLYYIWTFCFLI